MQKIDRFYKSVEGHKIHNCIDSVAYVAKLSGIVYRKYFIYFPFINSLKNYDLVYPLLICYMTDMTEIYEKN